MGAAAEDAAEAPAPATNGNGTGAMTTNRTVPAGQPPSGGGASSRYLVVFHAVSAGLNGAALGSDEQEIVFIVAVVLDVRDNQVLHKREGNLLLFVLSGYNIFTTSKFLRDVNFLAKSLRQILDIEAIVIPQYRDRLKGVHILLSNSQAGQDRKVMQEQEEISRNHVQPF